MVIQRPVLHGADARGHDAIDDEHRVVQRTEIPTEERVALPDLLERGPVGQHLGDPRDADLVMAVVHVAQLHLGIGGDLGGLAVAAQVGDVDREAVGLHGRHRPQPRLVAIDGGELRELGGPDHAERERDELRESGSVPSRAWTWGEHAGPPEKRQGRRDAGPVARRSRTSVQSWAIALSSTAMSAAMVSGVSSPMFEMRKVVPLILP